MIEGTRRPQTVRYSFSAITVSVSRTCLSSLLKCWHHPLGRYSVLLSEPAGKILTGHQSTIYWVPWCLSPSLFHSGKQDIFRPQNVCCRDDLSQSHLSEWAKGECFGSGFVQLQSVCLSCLHGFGGTGDRVTDEVMFCFQSARRKEGNKDQNSETQRLT